MSRVDTCDIIPPIPTNIFVVIVTYNPTSNIINLINALPVNVQKFIVDNNSQGQSHRFIDELSINENVIIIKNETNVGIAKALNQGLEAGAKLSFKWAITFDQDSLPTPTIIQLLIDTYNNYSDKNKLAMVAANYDTNGSTYLKKRIDLGLKTIEMRVLITSGSMLSIPVFEEVGAFREDFFIDCVDIEYCLRLKSKGYKIVISSEVGFNHAIGLSQSKKIFGINFTSSTHNVMRRYYMARNNVILTKMYLFKFPLYILNKNFTFLKSIISIIAVDDNKKEKLKTTFKGIFNGIKN